MALRVSAKTHSAISVDCIQHRISSLIQKVERIFQQILSHIQKWIGMQNIQPIRNPGFYSEIIRFYQDEIPNRHGYTRAQILQWNDQQLEDVHNYIQWLFPLEVNSSVDPCAPVLTSEVKASFTKDPTLRKNLLEAFARMLRFYGLVQDPQTKQITRSAAFSIRAQVWLYSTPGHHNFLRMTRIMSSLNALGCKEYAQALQKTLLDIARKEGGSYISSETIRHWQKAC